MNTTTEEDRPDRDELNQRVMTMVRWLLYLSFIVIAYFILQRLAPVLMPVVAAAFIAYLLDPLVDKLVAKGVNRVLAVTLLLVGFLTIVTTLFVTLVPLIADDVARFIEALPGWLQGGAEWAADALGYELPDSWGDYLSGEAFAKLLTTAAVPVFSLASAILGGFLSLLGFLAELLLIPVFAFYFLVDWDNIVLRFKRMIPHRHRAEVVEIAGEVDSVVSGWIRGQMTVTTILAVLYAIAFKIIGLHLAITMGLIVGLLTIIPFLGTFVGALITLALILLDWQGPNQLIAVGGVFVVLHLLEAAILTPKIVGHRVGLSEVGALFSVLAGGKLLGFTGVLLAVPLAASIAVLIRRALRYYEDSEFFTEGAKDAWVEAAADVVPPPKEETPEGEPEPDEDDSGHSET